MNRKNICKILAGVMLGGVLFISSSVSASAKVTHNNYRDIWNNILTNRNKYNENLVKFSDFLLNSNNKNVTSIIIGNNVTYNYNDGTIKTEDFQDLINKDGISLNDIIENIDYITSGYDVIKCYYKVNYSCDGKIIYSKVYEGYKNDKFNIEKNINGYKVKDGQQLEYNFEELNKNINIECEKLNQQNDDKSIEETKKR